MNRRFTFLPGIALGALLVVAASPATAQQTFFGEDLDGGTNTRASLSNAMNAEMNFLSFLTGVGTEDFESFADGDSSPLNLSFPGTGGATLQGGGAINTVTSGTNGFGRYPVSGENYWEVGIFETGGQGFYIDFGSPIAAFGFYGIDVGDFGGQMSLSFLSGSPMPVTVPHTVGGFGSPDGAGFFFGYINTANPFTRVDFLFDNSGAGGQETFAFDDMTIGSVEQVVVPEPSTVVLFGSGLLGLAFIGFRRRRDGVDLA